MTAMAQSADFTPRIAVIGCGHWGKNLIRNFHALGALAAVCDARPDPARAEAERWTVRVLDTDEALASPEIDAIVIAAPAEMHAGLALRAIESGKHVFVEKPLALAVDEAAAVRDAAKAGRRVAMVGHLLRYHPAFLKLHELVSEGSLGRLQYLYSNRLNLGRIRREEDVFWSFAPHDISMILALAGEDPESVEAVGHCYLHSQIADVTTTHLRFASGINAHVFVSWLHPCKEQKLIVVGDAGMAVFDDGNRWEQKLVLYPHRVAWHNSLPELRRAEAVPVVLDEAEPLTVECRHFLDSIREGRAPRTDASEGIAVLRVLDAARRSMRSGRPTRLAAGSAAAYFVHPSAFVEEECTIGAGTRIWHFAHILRRSRIGRDCVIGQNVAVGPFVSIGDRCKIQNNVSVYPGVVLEDAVFCGPSCVFTNVVNPRAEIERKDEYRPTRVGRGATIGANATIVCGHDIGSYAFIAAGAVVTHDVPAHALVAGNPARQVGWMSRAGHRLGNDLVCPVTGERYIPDGNGGLVPAGETREVA